MRYFVLVCMTAACVLGLGSRCYGQGHGSVSDMTALALINLRSDDVTQSETGAIQIYDLVESGRINVRHAAGLQLIDSLFSIAATDDRWITSGVAVGMLLYLDSVAGEPRVINEARWIDLYAVVQHPSVRYGILRQFNDRHPGPEGVSILGQLAVLSQNHRGDLERVVEFMRQRGPAGTSELLGLLDAGAFTNPQGRSHLRWLLGLEDG